MVVFFFIERIFDIFVVLFVEWYKISFICFVVGVYNLKVVLVFEYLKFN